MRTSGTTVLLLDIRHAIHAIRHAIHARHAWHGVATTCPVHAPRRIVHGRGTMSASCRPVAWRPRKSSHAPG